MPHTPGRGHEALRRGRWSKPGADYFLTFCTRERRPGLTSPELVAAILAQSQKLAVENTWQTRPAVIMPDHIHLLVTLAVDCELSTAVRLFKGRLAPMLSGEGLRWQHAYFDHRVRSAEDLLPIFLYIFLNLYRAGLVPSPQTWPGYFCSEEDWRWFGELTNASCPHPEWLR